MEYKIVYANDAATLSMLVNDYIKKGWVITGGVSYDSANRRLIQAIYK